MMKTEITQIKIRLEGGREIELSAAEARAVHAELGRLFDMDQSTAQDILEAIRKLPNPSPPGIVPYAVPIWVPVPQEWPFPWKFYCETKGGTTGPGTLCMDLSSAAAGG